MPGAWAWQKNAARVYGEDNVYGGIFSFILLSRDAARYLYGERLSEAARGVDADRVIHCEAFAASALMNEKRFKCGQVNDLIPGSVNQRSFHPAFPDLHMPNFLLGDLIDSDPRVEMYHPVFDADAYLVKVAISCQKIRRAVEFSRNGAVPPSNLVPDEIRLKFVSAGEKLIT